jgi:transposase
MAAPEELLSDELWAEIAPLLPKNAASPKGGGQWIDDRRCLEGVLWVLTSGLGWQKMPKQYPSGSTCWRRMQVWAGEGVLSEVHAKLAARAATASRVAELFLDATFVAAKGGATTSATPSLARE